MAAARSLLLRVGRRSMRRDVNRIQRQRCRTIPTDRLRSATLCGRRMRHHSSPSCLGRQALPVAVTISTADLAIDQNPAKTDVQSASGFFAPTPVRLQSMSSARLLLPPPSEVGIIPGLLLRVVLPCTLGAALTAFFDVGALDEKFSRMYCSSSFSKSTLKMSLNFCNASICRLGFFSLASFIFIIASLRSMATLFISSHGFSIGSWQCCG